jgi:hypothetical protein
MGVSDFSGIILFQQKLVIVDYELPPKIGDPSNPYKLDHTDDRYELRQLIQSNTRKQQ